MLVKSWITSHQPDDKWIEKTRQSAKTIFRTSIPSLSQCSAAYLKPCQILQHIRCPGELRHLGSSCRKNVWVSSRSSTSKVQLVHVSPSQQPWAWQCTVITTRAQSVSVQESKQANGERESALLLIHSECRLFSTFHSSGFSFFMWKRYFFVEKKVNSMTWASRGLFVTASLWSVTLSHLHNPLQHLSFPFYPPSANEQNGSSCWSEEGAITWLN